MRKSRMSGSVEGVTGNRDPYSEQERSACAEEPDERAAKKGDDASHVPFVPQFAPARNPRYRAESTSGRSNGEGQE